ncbi:hypothetical protein GCM10025331_06730 [Actinoplanes utahensis]|nr:hypothetical protein Aut01nite_14000 [Actinoplanes utahensis]
MGAVLPRVQLANGDTHGFEGTATDTDPWQSAGWAVAHEGTTRTLLRRAGNSAAASLTGGGSGRTDDETDPGYP